MDANLAAVNLFVTPCALLCRQLALCSSRPDTFSPKWDSNCSTWQVNATDWWPWLKNNLLFNHRKYICNLVKKPNAFWVALICKGGPQ